MLAGHFERIDSVAWSPDGQHIVSGAGDGTLILWDAINLGQVGTLETYCSGIWSDCLTLVKMWQEGKLDGIVNIESEELEIARSQPWKGSPAILASDGIFSFGAHQELE